MATVTVTVTATPPPTFSIDPQSATVGEGDVSVSFTVSRSDSSAAQTLYVSTVQNQGFANEDDYVGKLNEAVVLSTGQTEGPVTISVNDDTAIEGDETFGLVVQQSPTDPVNTFLASATFTITDDDTSPPSGGTTERVSVASDGTQSNANSFGYVQSISADGRFVAFSSDATNLVPTPTMRQTCSSTIARAAQPSV